ncbi:tetratricopeptide repeat protein, partial [Patescibacteria group bacterium]|nr:tetratricopeptide repeat protein [Patescibacteria group bacterium]
LLALAAKTHKVQALLSGQALPTSETLSSSNSVSKLPAIVVALPVIIAVVLLFVNARRIIAAEITYKNALDALVQNEATLTFNSMREAINLNPRVDRYHASYAQVNLALANSIASKDPEEITDEDRASIAQLIQQAIAEGKATVALNPQRAGNWEVLASIYRSIIPFAQGADQFAIQTYKQAVALDPVNPSLRINLGGVFYSLQNYNDAIRAFELAVLAKPDLANAHFNLSAALRENGEIEAAVEEMKLVLALVDRGTRDYELSKQELEKLNEMLPLPERPEEEETIEATPETLTTPEAVEEAPIEPIELPEEAAPPETPEGETETELSPTPTPTPTPTLP